jgi:hypothetical protein
LNGTPANKEADSDSELHEIFLGTDLRLSGWNAIHIFTGRWKCLTPGKILKSSL